MKPIRARISLALALWAVLAAAGCRTLPDGRRWGQDGFSSFDGARITRAARDAFLNPNTLVPLAGAAVLAIDDFDEKTSDWAVERNPVFGSDDSARDASDALMALLGAEALATALATPSGPDRGPWTQAKLRGIAVEAVGVGSAQATTLVLKAATDRERPDSRGKDSFPSFHSSSSFACATLANRNLDHIDLSERLRWTLKTGNVALAAGVAWARVEGGRHYPSDVLFGAALGNFFAAFIHDAFLNLPADAPTALTGFADEAGAGVQLSVRF